MPVDTAEFRKYLGAAMEALNSRGTTRNISDLKIPETISTFSEFGLYDEWVLSVSRDLIDHRIDSLSLSDVLELVFPLCRLQKNAVLLNRDMVRLVESVNRQFSGNTIIKWRLWINLLECMHRIGLENKQVSRIAIDELASKVSIMNGNEIMAVVNVCVAHNYIHSVFLSRVIKFAPIVSLTCQELTVLEHLVNLGGQQSKEDIAWLTRYIKFTCSEKI